MEKDYRTASGKFWQTVWRLRRGKRLSANTVYGGGGELLVSTGDIVGRWKEYFEDLLNPTDMPSVAESEAEDSEVDSFITQAEVTEVVQQLLGGKALGVDEIRPEYLKSLDVVVLADTSLQHSVAVRDTSVTSPINLFIIVIYSPPGPLGNFLDEMDTLLSAFPSDSTPLTVLGDFNLPSDKLHSSGLLALLNSFSLSFNSCPPTHKEGNVLDLVFTHPSPAIDMTVTPLHISDHHLVSFTITLPVLPKRNSQHLSLTRRNLHSISPSSVASCTLSSLPDHESFSSLPLDSATDTLLSSLSSTMVLLCPLSTIRKKNSSTAPWLSDILRNNRRELRSAVRKWKKSKLDTDLISYRTLLSNFSLDVTSFYKEKLETSAQDP
ncbi:hypothetical protein QTP70_003199 [Hemibagrus guttatus]|uniref:Endonuclease/exonuclease/phosphatase domain-containing protein n=1 Tax=Hemibagrus guttatus TaxID=175788 RepID=A0AAE0PQM6_9TELE|nr:hypothetical protein QTP70_003199 [Hemibagrus guttatus]